MWEGKRKRKIEKEKGNKVDVDVFVVIAFPNVNWTNNNSKQQTAAKNTTHPLHVSFVSVCHGVIFFLLFVVVCVLLLLFVKCQQNGALKKSRRTPRFQSQYA